MLDSVTQRKNRILRFLELSRPLTRPPGAVRVEIEGFGWAWARILGRKCGPDSGARALVWPGPMHFLLNIWPKPIEILRFSPSHSLEAALVAD